MFHHPAWAVGSYSSCPLAAKAVGTKSTGGFHQRDVSPCRERKLSFLSPVSMINGTGSGKNRMWMWKSVAVLLTALPSRMYQCKSHASSNKWNMTMSHTFQQFTKEEKILPECDLMQPRGRSVPVCPRMTGRQFHDNQERVPWPLGRSSIRPLAWSVAMSLSVSQVKAHFGKRGPRWRN